MNVCRTKALTNMRAANKEIKTGLDEPRIMSLDDALEYINDDELVEVGALGRGGALVPAGFRLVPAGLRLVPAGLGSGLSPRQACGAWGRGSRGWLKELGSFVCCGAVILL